MGKRCTLTPILEEGRKKKKIGGKKLDLIGPLEVFAGGRKRRKGKKEY